MQPSFCFSRYFPIVWYVQVVPGSAYHSLLPGYDIHHAPLWKKREGKKWRRKKVTKVKYLEALLKRTAKGAKWREHIHSHIFVIVVVVVEDAKCKIIYGPIKGAQGHEFEHSQEKGSKFFLKKCIFWKMSPWSTLVSNVRYISRIHVHFWLSHTSHSQNPVCCPFC